MKDNNILENPAFESYWLAHADADSVFQWLKEQQRGYLSEEIVEILLERDEPLIKLGLALTCKLSDETALSLYRNGDATIKKAVLAGPSAAEGMFGINISGWWVSDSGVLEELLQSFDENLGLLGMLLSNKYIPIDMLINLYTRAIPTRRRYSRLTDNHFGGLTDEQWLQAIACTISNPILRNSHYREHMESGLHDELDHPLSRCEVCAVFEAAWSVFGFVPVNDLSSTVLSHLGKILACYGDGRTTNGSEWWISRERNNSGVLKDIKRWEKTESDDKYGYFHDCRLALGRLLEEAELKDSADVALRQAYYLNRSWKKPEEVREAFEKDKDKFLDVAIRNQSLYVQEDIRNALRRCCEEFLYSQDVPFISYSERFREMSDSLERQHPEWFTESGEDPPFHQVNELSLRAEIRN